MIKQWTVLHVEVYAYLDATGRIQVSLDAPPDGVPRSVGLAQLEFTHGDPPVTGGAETPEPSAVIDATPQSDA